MGVEGGAMIVEAIEVIFSVFGIVFLCEVFR